MNPRRTPSPRATGRQGEDLAAEFLKKSGYRVLERNYSCKLGEIDIIARDGETLVFIEVKARRSSAFGPAVDALTLAKQKRLYRLALYYLQRKKIKDQPMRFDVVAVDMSREKEEITIYRNAFEVDQ